MVLLDTPTPYLYGYCNSTVVDCSLEAELQCTMFRACHNEISEVTVRGMSLLLSSVSPPLVTTPSIHGAVLVTTPSIHGAVLVTTPSVQVIIVHLFLVLIKFKKYQHGYFWH